MNRLISALALLFLVTLAGGCASKSDYVLPDQARKLSAEQITQAFSNIREDYEAIDDPGLTATVIYIADGNFSATWEKGWFFDGSLKGNWYTDGDRLCVKTTTKFNGSDLYCVSIYKVDETYTAVHPDGSYQGISTLTPLCEIMSSEQLIKVFIGNTVHGSYPDKGEIIEHWEYFDVLASFQRVLCVIQYLGAHSASGFSIKGRMLRPSHSLSPGTGALEPASCAKVG